MDKGTFEYEIRKDFRNNQIVREVDERRLRDLWQSLAVGAALVVVLLFSAWQHFELLRHGYKLEQMQRERAAESDINRHLRLENGNAARAAAHREARHRAARHGRAAVTPKPWCSSASPPRRRRPSPSSPPGKSYTWLQPDPHWRPMLKSRLMVAAGALVLWVVGIEARLVVLQVVQHDELVARAERQQMSTVPAPAKRGEIFDRNGRLLAYSVDADTIYAVPTEITDPGEDRGRVVRRVGRLHEEVSCRTEGAAVAAARAFVVREAARDADAGQARGCARSRRHRFPQGEQAVLSESRAGRQPARLRRRRQRRPGRHRSHLRQDGARPRRQAAGADRRARAMSSAGSSDRRPPARRSS